MAISPMVEDVVMPIIGTEELEHARNWVTTFIHPIRNKATDSIESQRTYCIISKRTTPKEGS